MPITLDGTNGITTPTYGGADTSEYLVPVTAFKNRLINSGMQIDQRNAGASVSLVSGGGVGYPADRWYVENFTDGTATVQQITDAPTGFSNSIRYTVTATDSSLASDQSAFIQQRIEGFNTSDLMFGTANAQTVTVSFWVKSSVTGTFGVSLANSAYNRGYPVSFTVNSANTWEQKSVTITGDTTGTWIGATNGIGIRVSFGLAAGSARVATSGAWSASTVLGVSGQVNLMATNGATFQITGVQLEVGSTATSFDYRPYGTEFDLCRRYYEQYNYTNAGGANQYIGSGGVGMAWTGTDVRIPIGYYPKRASATCAFSGTIRFATNAFGQNFTSVTFDNAGVNTVLLFNGSASGFTAGQAQQVTAQAANTFISISAEL